MSNKKMTRQAKKAAGINKSVHIEMHNNVHKKLRALLFLKEMSLQGFFRLMAESFTNGDEYIEKLVDQRIDDIKNKKLDQLRNINKSELYDAIEENSPFKKED
tara:strand:- start:131 stop:439 length:309 start_codon:yes stop_codon:yes gene_type:complete